MPEFRLTSSVTIFTVIAMMLCFALAGPSMAAGEEESALAAEYSSGAKRCLACHKKIRNKKSAHDTLLTNTDLFAGPAFPMADGKHYCEACHGPAAAHTKKQAGGGRVPPPMSFSPDISAGEKNTVCMACHDGPSISHWMGSHHDTGGAACVGCHTVHAESDPVSSLVTQSNVCYACHEDQKKAEQADQTLHIVGNDEVGCSSCHDPHGGSEATLCIDCHLMNTKTIAGQSRKARDFHNTAVKKDLSCLRCHGGVAHGVPDWIADIREQQQQMDD